MCKATKNLIVIFTIILFSLLIQFTHKAAAHDSMMQFESRSTTDGGFSYLKNLDDCFSSGKAMWLWEYSSLDNVCIPTMLSKSNNTCKGSGVSIGATLASVARGVVYYNMISSFPFGTILAFIAIGIEYVIMVDICTNAYIVAPHEYINLDQGWVTCEEQGPEAVVNIHNDALNAIDVPFYYHCDPYYNPDDGSTLSSGNIDDEKLIGRTWGYMGAASPYCAGDAEKYARKEMVGKVVMHYVSGWTRFWEGMTRCHKAGEGTPERNQLILSAKEGIQYMMPAHYHPYYRFASGIGKIQLCIATPYTLLPIRVGCSYVPPPSDDLDLDNFLEVYLQGTRCYYFITGRTDLASLGKYLQTNDENGIKKQYVKDFLTSDMHVISTVVGCIQDLLTKVFIESNVNVSGNKPFFQVVQERLKQIVYTILVLYVSIIGIKLISAGETPQRGELIMYVIRLALVLYFTTGSVWYETQNGKKTGLYPLLLESSSEISGMFMGAQNDNDPIGFCKYQYAGDNILKQRDLFLADPSLEPTFGSNGAIKMTVWDLIDCKLLNYLNLGSCKYTISGLIGVWIISAALLVSITGFLLAIVSFIYCFMLLLVVFQFTHIFILSMFVLTILILVSPIIICFALFEHTKDIFKKWMLMILGYILYPSLLFAFIALMLATFDSVFFGDIDIVNHPDNIKEACSGVDSIFCVTYDAVGKDPCSANFGQINGALTTQLNLGPFGKFTILTPAAVSAYFDPMMRLMLFAFLFYLFIGSVSGFLAVLTGVQDLSGMAKGSVNAFNALASIGKKGASALSSKKK